MAAGGKGRCEGKFGGMGVRFKLECPGCGMRSSSLVLGDRESGLCYCAACNRVVNSWASCWRPFDRCVCRDCGRGDSLRPLASYDPSAKSQLGSAPWLCPCCGFEHLESTTGAMVELEELRLTPATLVHCRIVTEPVDGRSQAVLPHCDDGPLKVFGVEPGLLHWWCEAEVGENLGQARFVRPIVDSGRSRLAVLEIEGLLRLELSGIEAGLRAEAAPARALWRVLENCLPLVVCQDHLCLNIVDPAWPEPGLSKIAGWLYDFPSSLLGLTHLWDAQLGSWVESASASIGLDFGGDEVLWLEAPWSARPFGDVYSNRIGDFETGVQAVLVRFADGRLARWPSGAGRPREADEIQKLAEAGERQAQYELGLAYEGGDESIAFQWFLRSAEQWHGPALWKVGQIHLQGGDGAGAAKWIKRAAKQGVKEAFFPLAELYRTGIGLEQDLGRAREFYSAAGHKGDARGLLWAGRMFARGEGGPTCYASAKWHLSLAASEHGLVEAALELGLLHRGRGESDKAVEWLSRAAEQGSQQAKEMLAQSAPE